MKRMFGFGFYTGSIGSYNMEAVRQCLAEERR
jgi:hypothetical protein